MAQVYGLWVGIITAVALCKYALADWNATDESLTNRTVSHCHRHGNRDNCTDTGQWTGHFSKCPEYLRYFCIHGECRYVKEQKTPSCRCQHGYIGSRCEYVDVGLQIGERRQVIIICITTLLIILILLIVFIFICSHRRSSLCRRRGRRGKAEEEPRNGTEKLSMMDSGVTHTHLTSDAAEHTDAV